MLIQHSGSSIRFVVCPVLYDAILHETSRGTSSFDFEDWSPELEQSFKTTSAAVWKPVKRTQRQVTIEIENHPSLLRWVERLVAMAGVLAADVDEWNWRGRDAAKRAMDHFDRFFIVPDDIQAIVDRVNDPLATENETNFAEFEMNARGWIWWSVEIHDTTFDTLRFDPAQAHLRLRRMLSDDPRPVSAHKALNLLCLMKSVSKPGSCVVLA